MAVAACLPAPLLLQVIQCYTPYLSGIQLFGADHTRCVLLGWAPTLQWLWLHCHNDAMVMAVHLQHASGVGLAFEHSCSAICEPASLLGAQCFAHGAQCATPGWCAPSLCLLGPHNPGLPYNKCTAGGYAPQ